MKTITRAFAAVVLLCATLAWTAPAHAIPMYSVTLETTTEPATFAISSSESKSMRISVTLGKGERKTIEIDPLPYVYEFTITRCGAVSKHPWYRGGLGVTVIAGGCGTLSLLMKR